MPEDSFAPLLLQSGIAMLFVGLLLQDHGPSASSARVICRARAVAWLWPRARSARAGAGAWLRRRSRQPQDLPVGPIGRHGVGWWGVGTLVATEAALFAYLLFAYFYTGAHGPSGLAARAAARLSKLALPNTVLLLLSSALHGGASAESSQAPRPGALLGFGVALAARASCSCVVQCLEWQREAFQLGDLELRLALFRDHGTSIWRT